jgi:hypothetical protein
VLLIRSGEILRVKRGIWVMNSTKKLLINGFIIGFLIGLLIISL